MERHLAADDVGVALLAEGVDRNLGCIRVEVVIMGSPSSRRAWIEIGCGQGRRSAATVALLAEGVDRNFDGGGRIALEELVALLAEGVDRNHAGLCAGAGVVASPSSRRAWIEMRCPVFAFAQFACRPPRGGRG